MKTASKLLVLTLTLATGAILIAQDGPPPREGGRQGGPGGPGGPGRLGAPDGPRGPGGMRPPPAIIGAIDINHDGEIDAEEIAKASESLKKLDRNGDGKLSREEFLGPRPGGPGGPDGPRGPGEPRRDGRGRPPGGPHGPGGPDQRPQRPPDQ